MTLFWLAPLALTTSRDRFDVIRSVRTRPSRSCLRAQCVCAEMIVRCALHSVFCRFNFRSQLVCLHFAQRYLRRHRKSPAHATSSTYTYVITLQTVAIAGFERNWKGVLRREFFFFAGFHSNLLKWIRIYGIEENSKIRNVIGMANIMNNGVVVIPTLQFD